MLWNIILSLKILTHVNINIAPAFRMCFIFFAVNLHRSERSKMADKFINLQQIVMDWAWKRYDRTATSRKQKKLRAKERKSPNEYIAVTIDWNEVRYM